MVVGTVEAQFPSRIPDLSVEDAFHTYVLGSPPMHRTQVTRDLGRRCPRVHAIHSMPHAWVQSNLLQNHHPERSTLPRHGVGWVFYFCLLLVHDCLSELRGEQPRNSAREKVLASPAAFGMGRRLSLIQGCGTDVEESGPYLHYFVRLFRSKEDDVISQIIDTGAPRTHCSFPIV